MKKIFYITLSFFLLLTACKDNYECTTYHIDGTGEIYTTNVELLDDVVKSDADHYAKNIPYTLCLDENDKENFVYNDSSILAKVWDCTGEHGGGAYIGACGECIGGNTGKVCEGEISEEECFDVYGGYIDNCGLCVSGTTGQIACTTNNNTYDCANVYGGTAYIDECGNCVEGTTERSPCVYDVDGNYYESVKIGTQIWMAANLKTTRFSNGNSIVLITNNTTWSSQANVNGAAMCWQQNSTSYKNTYGGLYNYYVVSDERNVCPTGWHIPTYNDWTVLRNSVGSTSSATLLKSTTGWVYNGTDSYAFKALPGGSRTQIGTFSNNQNEGLWWSSSNATTTQAYIFRLYSSSSSSYVLTYDKGYGASIRCLKDN